MKNEILQRLKTVRGILMRENIDAFYISGTDPHRSEYLCDHWQTRHFFSGFSGSFGEVVITLNSAGLWTDTRYFLQAEEELAGTGIDLHKLRVPEAVPVVKWLVLNLPEGARIGVEPASLPLVTYRLFASEFRKKNFEIVFLPGFTDEVWTNRPVLPGQHIEEMDVAVAGEARLEKLVRITQNLNEKGADMTILTALDDIAWTFNLRGSDIAYNPVFLSFAIIGNHEKQLFVRNGALDNELNQKLVNEEITVSRYEDAAEIMSGLSDKTICIDPEITGTAVWEAIRKKNRIVEGNSIATLFKSQKNETELVGFRKAMQQDGVAMVKFLHWFSENVENGNITEFTAGRKLLEFRSEQPGFRGESFAPIVGYAAHGAIVHLTVNEHNASPIQPKGILLVDSGGQYITGTTDITRTFSVGPVTQQMKHDFTLVLKGMINLSMAVFPAGTTGAHIDILARRALWENGLNYGHGTGHGVGHFLNVHEGPASIRQEINPQEIKPGMVFSNEPGLYRTGEYGIRTENMMACVEKETTEFGRFLAFETLTLCPIDKTLIISELLSEKEREWLNNYHEKVREELQDLLDDEQLEFLLKYTAPL